jgi:ABC-type antimicrobial peptide transport system permease subunit
MSVFAAAALLLAIIGIYGLTAYSIRRRQQEIGIRIAMGARPEDVTRMMLLHGLRLIFLGVIIGLLSAFALARLIAGLLFGVTARDPLVFAAVPVLLTAIAVFAVWVPSRRAARMNPIEALR